MPYWGRNQVSDQAFENILVFSIWTQVYSITSKGRSHLFVQFVKQGKPGKKKLTFYFDNKKLGEYIYQKPILFFIKNHEGDKLNV